VVVHHSSASKVVRMLVRTGGDEVGQYSADGMVIATSTGSTAYSLSAGGPIMTPEVDALVITPIAAHSLAVRPVVVPGDSIISLELVGRLSGKIAVSYDGDALSDLGRDERLVVQRSDTPVRLIRLPGEGFFPRMRQKLHWGDLIDRQDK
jgi:NAD+ kinase